MNKQLDEISIVRFRRLRSVHLAGLGAVNLIAGANNSGKTSVLEAIGAFCRPFDVRECIASLRRREDKPLSRIIEDDLRWFFAQDEAGTGDASGFNHIEGEGPFPVRKVVARYRRMVGEFTDRVQVDVDEQGEPVWEDGTSERIGAKIEVEVRTSAGRNHPPETISHSFTLWANANGALRLPGGSEPELPLRTIAPFSHRTERLQLAQLSQATEEGWKEEAVDLLAKLDPSIAGLEIISPSGVRPQLAVRHSQLGVRPLSAFGDGVRRVLLLALTIPVVRDGVLLVDEIENAVHVSAIPKVFAWLVDSCRKYAVQLVATTHSLEAVDAMLSAEIGTEEVVGYRLHPSNGGLAAQHFGGAVLQHLRLERGLDVRWR